MKRNVKLLLFCLMAALLLTPSEVSEAGVTLVPRVNSRGNILKDESGAPIASEDYVLLGKFKHRLKFADGDQETEATPILWRVMSLDASPNPTKAILLSHRLPESMSYQGQVVNVDGWYRSPLDDPPVCANRWDGSEVQKWLNDASQTTAYKVYLAETYWKVEPKQTSKPTQVEGFLYGFAKEERDALLSYPDGTKDSKVSLPSGWTVDNSQFRYGELGLWFGLDNGAYYKGERKNQDYWTRTPLSSDGRDLDQRTAGARYVVADGDINFAPVHEGDFGAYGVRPVVLLNLGAPLFKAASDDFAPSFNSASAIRGGDESNPWILVLSGLEPGDWPIDFVSADRKPNGAAIDATGKTMTVSWDRAISPAVRRWPASDDFTLVRPGSGSNPISVTSSDTNDRILILTFADATRQREVVTLDYNLNTDAISFDETGTPGSADVVAGFTDLQVTNDSTVAPDPGPGPTQQSLAVLLVALNDALAPHSVAPLAPIPAAVGAPITQALASNAAFAKKVAPIPAYPGTRTPIPSFSASVLLGSGTTGDTLALRYAVDLSALPGFGNWKNPDDGGKVALLNAQNISFAYEYEDSTWKGLLGAESRFPWADALGAGVVEFTEKGIVLNYAVIDGLGPDSSGEPFASGGVLVIPDLAKDNKIDDPVWLTRKMVVPTALTLTPASLTLKKGESAAVKVAFTPADATEREIIWTIGDSAFVSVTKAASGTDTWTVKGLSEGITSLTAVSGADGRVRSPLLTVTVLPAEVALIESLTVSPLPPYHPGEEVEIRAKLKRAASSVTATVRRPDGTVDTPTVNVEGTDARAEYTLTEPGDHTVTVEATDAATGAVWTKVATLTVTEGDGGGSGGGCNAAGPAVPALAAMWAMWAAGSVLRKR